MKRIWQARFRNWVGGSKYGVLCIGVRRRGRGEWRKPADAPPSVRDFLWIVQRPGQAGNWTCPDFKTLEELQQGATNCKMRLDSRLGLLVAFEVEEPDREPRLQPINGLVRRLISEGGCGDSLYSFYRGVYKISTCGLSIGFLIGSQWVYCDSLPKEPLADTLRSNTVYGIRVTGYVEGVDFELEPITLTQQRGSKRLTAADFWAACDQAEKEARAIAGLIQLETGRGTDN